MIECKIAKRLDELAFSAEPSRELAELRREYALTGKVSQETLAKLVGDRDKSAKMETVETTIEQMSQLLPTR